MRKWIVGGILLVALLMQLAFVFTVNTAPESDMKGYDERGLMMAEHGTFQYGDVYNGSTYRPPMYTLFLAGIYKVFGHSLRAVYVFQVLLSMGSMLFIYLLGSRLWKPAVAMIALILSVLYVPFTGYSGIILSENLFLFLLLAFSYMALRAVQTGKLSYTAAAGICCALSAMTRSISLLLPVVIIALLLLFHYKQVLKKQALKQIALFFVAMFLTISPWTIRNYVDTKEFVLIDAISGLNLLIGNSEYATGFFTSKVWETEGWKQAHQPPNNLPQADAIMKQYALSWIKSHPTAFVDLTIKRFGLYFHVKTDWFTVPYGWKNILINKMGFEARYHTFLFYSFFLGLVLIRRRKLQLIMVAAAVFYFIGLSSLFYVSPRYRLPAMPFMLLYCAYAFYWLYAVVRGYISKRAGHARTGVLESNDRITPSL